VAVDYGPDVFWHIAPSGRIGTGRIAGVAGTVLGCAAYLMLPMTGAAMAFASFCREPAPRTLRRSLLLLLDLALTFVPAILYYSVVDIVDP
jgi:hypothetical protein